MSRQCGIPPEIITEIRRLWELPSEDRPTQLSMGHKMGYSQKTISNVVSNKIPHDPNYIPPEYKHRSWRKYWSKTKRKRRGNCLVDRPIKRPPGAINGIVPEGSFACLSCGCVNHSKDVKLRNYGRPFKNQKEADQCCRE